MHTHASISFSAPVHAHVCTKASFNAHFAVSREESVIFLSAHFCPIICLFFYRNAPAESVISSAEIVVDCGAFTSLVRARDKFPQLQVLVNVVSSVNYLNP